MDSEDDGGGGMARTAELCDPVADRVQIHQCALDRCAVDAAVDRVGRLVRPRGLREGIY